MLRLVEPACVKRDFPLKDHAWTSELAELGQLRDRATRVRAETQRLIDEYNEIRAIRRLRLKPGIRAQMGTKLYATR